MDRDSVAKIAQQCNVYVVSRRAYTTPPHEQHFRKREAAKLAQEQSAHLFLCLFVSDLTHRYGPVIRQARVVNVLDAAFDVLVPEFGIEKRVHVDQMPIEVTPCHHQYILKSDLMLTLRTMSTMSILTHFRSTGLTRMSSPG